MTAYIRGQETAAPGPNPAHLLVCVSKVLLEHSHAFAHILSVAASMLQQQGRVVPTEALWPTGLKIQQLLGHLQKVWQSQSTQLLGSFK